MNDPLNKQKSARRFLRNKKQGAARLGDEANRHVDRLFINRLQNLAQSWKFVVSWSVLGVLLAWVLVIQTRALQTYYTEVVPRNGGTYVEGIPGPLTNMNPIYASTTADLAVSKLMFAGLLKYNDTNELIPDLAESIEADEKASTFTLKLRPDLKWHDGQPLTSKDVVFTVSTIQQPEARSSMQRSWEGVSVSAPDLETVVFTLPGSFSPFPHLLTQGILPEHLLGQYTPSELRSVEFNSLKPIGSGPFKFQRIVNVDGAGRDDREIKVQLLANRNYHLGGPKLDAFTFWVAPEQSRINQLFAEGQLSGAVSIDINQVDLTELDAKTRSFNLTNGVFLFYKTTNSTLADTALRQALSKAINVGGVINQLNKPLQQIKGPLLPEQLGYSSDNTQISFNLEQAQTDLDSLGWLKGVDGVRAKDGQKLQFTITTQSGTEFETVAEAIASQFRNAGVDTTLDLREVEGFAENVLQNHVYSDMLVYAINIGIDPDVYSFWHSSQADQNSTIRLNLSEYSSEIVDEALEAGRSRTETDVRVTKYQQFVSQWVADAPAVALYRPRFTYYELSNIRGPRGQVLRSQIDRFRDVNLWTILTDRVPIDEVGDRLE